MVEQRQVQKEAGQARALRSQPGGDAYQDALGYAEAIIATVREPLIVLEGDLRVRSANRSFYRTFRVRPEETVGRLLYDLGNRHWDIPALRELLGEILPQNAAFEDFEVEHDFPDIGRRVMLLNARKLYREGNHAELILLAIEDVTALREAQQARGESEERLRAIIDNCPSAIFVKDPQGRYLLANKACQVYCGTPVEQVIGKTAHDCFPPNLADNLGADDRKVLQTGEALRYEAVMPAPGGTVTALTVKFPLRDASGLPYAVCGIATDITDLKRATEALRASEERFVGFMQHFPGLAWIKDERGRYVYANDAAVNAFATPRDRLYGKTDEEVFPPLTAAQFRDNDRKGLASAAGVRVVETLEQADGVLHHSLVSKFPIPGPDGAAALVGGMAIDITEEMRTRVALEEAHAALQESEQRLRTLSDNLPLGAVYQGIVDQQGRRRCTYISAGVERLFGVSPAEVMADATVLYGLIHEEDQAAFARQDEEALRTLTPLDCEFRSWTRSGSLIWVHLRSAPRRLANGETVWEGIVIDVTSRRRAEEELARERELLGTIIDRIPVMLTVYEPDTRVVRLNPAFERVTGWSMHDAAGLSLMEQCYPDPSYRQRVQEFMESCRDGWMDIRLRTRDGRDLETSWANIRLSSGTQVGIGIDITDRKRYERSLKEADRRKDEFLATLAHELRNPLAPLCNGLQVMKLAAGDAGAVEQARGVMERQLSQLVRLVDDLLDVSRITRGKLQLRRQHVDLATVVQSAVEGSRPVIESNRHDLTIRLPAEPVYLEADPTRLAQVFGNLLTNAAKYTDRGGRITLTAERRGGEVVVAVRDTGIGIAPDHLPRLFEMFSQVDSALERSQGGLGIGLSLVKGLVRMHAGSVEAQSDGLGKGSEFVVRLPILTEAPDPKTPQPGSSAAPASRTRRRILTADDNRDTAESLALVLRLQGHAVHAVHDGHEAVEAVAWFRPEFILLDIGMPRLNGFEAARRIRQQPGGKTIVLVAITGWGQEEDKRRASEAGFDYHLTKPVDPAALEKLLAELPVVT
jgi:PAS domain S-box-containing protein